MTRATRLDESGRVAAFSRCTRMCYSESWDGAEVMCVARSRRIRPVKHVDNRTWLSQVEDPDHRGRDEIQEQGPGRLLPVGKPDKAPAAGTGDKLRISRPGTTESSAPAGQATDG